MLADSTLKDVLMMNFRRIQSRIMDTCFVNCFMKLKMQDTNRRTAAIGGVGGSSMRPGHVSMCLAFVHPCCRGVRRSVGLS